MSFIEVRISAPAAEAPALARTLVEERLAACAQVLPGMTSVYRWQGAVETADEVLLLLKTSDDLFDELAVRAAQLHPYDVPEIVASPLPHLAEAYAGWLAQSLRPTG